MTTSTAVHPIDEHLPTGKLTVLGLQHVLVMYAGAVAVPLIVGRALKLSPEQVAMLISADLFCCGLVTLIQSLGATQWFGIKLPVMMGVTFASVAPMVAIAGATPGVEGAGLIFGAMRCLPKFRPLAYAPMSTETTTMRNDRTHHCPETTPSGVPGWDASETVNAPSNVTYPCAKAEAASDGASFAPGMWPRRLRRMICQSKMTPRPPKIATVATTIP